MNESQWEKLVPKYSKELLERKVASKVTVGDVDSEYLRMFCADGLGHCAEYLYEEAEVVRCCGGPAYLVDPRGRPRSV